MSGLVDQTGQTVGRSPSGQYGISALCRAGWRLKVSDDPIDIGIGNVSWTEVHNAEAFASVQDSTHSLHAGAHRWWYWESTVQDPLGPGALQIDWLIREIEYTAVGG